MKKVVDGAEERREVEEKRRGRIGGFSVDTTFWKGPSLVAEERAEGGCCLDRTGPRAFSISLYRQVVPKQVKRQLLGA